MSILTILGIIFLIVAIYLLVEATIAAAIVAGVLGLVILLAGNGNLRI